jgi:hypothetical protein
MVSARGDWAGRALWSGDPLRAWSVWAPLALAVGFWWLQGRYGFNPTDDGFVLGQAWRIAHGEVPHREFTSPRPLASAFMHLPEVMMPAGMLAVSRLIVTLQLLWIAFATVQLVLHGRWRLSGLQQFTLVGFAFLVNVGVWPIMAWHTIDGLFLGVTALWLVLCRPASRGDPARWIAVWLLAGLAPLAKQGYAVVPVLVAAAIAVSGQRSAWRYSPLTVVPAAGYLLWSGSDAFAQLYAGSGVALTAPVRRLAELTVQPPGLIIVLSAVLGFLVMAYGPGGLSLKGPVATAALIGPPLVAAHAEGFSLAGAWSYLAVLSLITVAVMVVRTWLLATVVAALLGLALAVSLSWGIPGPGLVTGSALAASVLLLWSAAIPGTGERFREMNSFTAVSVALLVTALVLTLIARERSVYREPRRSTLTATVDAPQFALIRVGPQSAQYLRDLQECLDRYPARQVAVLPDNPGLYPLLGLRNPFPSDWWLSWERSVDHEAKVTLALDALHRTAHWLVLFQSYDASTLPTRTIPQVSAPGLPFAYVPQDIELVDRIQGQPVRCGSLSGEYRP